jgi:hypothetical protein
MFSTEEHDLFSASSARKTSTKCITPFNQRIRSAGILGIAKYITSDEF